jgi:hypothetical protein
MEVFSRVMHEIRGEINLLNFNRFCPYKEQVSSINLLSTKKKCIFAFLIDYCDYLRVGILLTCGKDLHGRIISQRREVYRRHFFH